MFSTLSCFFFTLTLAHRSLPSGVTCSPQFSSANDPLYMPTPNISWAAYRILTCEAPIFWLSADVAEGQNITLAVGVVAQQRFLDSRINVAVIGPGLPGVPTELFQQPSVVYTPILSAMEANHGVVVMESAEDQSVCRDSTSQEILDMQYVDPELNACVFPEERTDTVFLYQLEETLVAPVTGLYKFAVWNAAQTTTKFWFACCDWDEDFITPYDIPETECPYCLAHPSESPPPFGWYKNFMEETTTSFPPLQDCTMHTLRPEDTCSQTALPTAAPTNFLNLGDERTNTAGKYELPVVIVAVFAGLVVGILLYALLHRLICGKTKTATVQAIPDTPTKEAGENANFV